MTKDDTMEAIGRFYESLTAAAKSGDSEGYAQHFVPNGVLLIPKRPAIVGHDAIRDWFEKFQQRHELAIDKFEQVQVDRLGDVALLRSWAAGSYIIKATDERVPFEQKYLDVFVYSEGRWLLAYHQAGCTNHLPGLWDRDWENE